MYHNWVLSKWGNISHSGVYQELKTEKKTVNLLFFEVGVHCKNSSINE